VSPTGNSCFAVPILVELPALRITRAIFIF
jgi:hypothetical protein